MPRKGENIYKRKDGRWEGRYIGCYDENHKAKYVYIYGKTYTEVKQKLAIERGRQKQHVPAEKKQITYGEVLDLWLHSTKTSIKESTYARYAHLINSHIKPQLGDYKLSMLSTEIIENFIENQLVEGQLDRTGGLAPKTVIDLLAIVKSTIGYAQYKGFPVICNLSRLSVKRKDKEMRVLTPSERESLIGILMEDMDSFKFGVFLALYTGIRIGELCALQWKDIDFARAIIQSDDTRTGYYIKNKNANRFTPFALDKIEPERICAFANELSRLPIKRDSRSLGIADRISFLQMYKAGNIQELDIEYHWDNNNSAKSLAAPIGVMAGGDVFSLDIHESYHGCHGLVAGTTGSGKSEFLQAFILSLAINYSPKEVSFVLVDFKGGDMARPFMAKPTAPALPHLSATISNLSGNILYRALVSLEAEIKSRQRIFNESAAILGVDKLDINSYHKYYKGGRLNTPLPHMVIIIDEFAQLKTQQPEFLAQLINVAQAMLLRRRYFFFECILLCHQ